MTYVWHAQSKYDVDHGRVGAHVLAALSTGVRTLQSGILRCFPVRQYFTFNSAVHIQSLLSMMLLCSPRYLQVIHFPREGAKLNALKVNAINSGLSLFSPNLHGHCYAGVNRQVT